MEKNCVAIIGARGGSKGYPGKNTSDLCGKPLIAWSILQAKATPAISEVYFTSDSEEILDIAQEYGATCIKRPAEYATDTINLEPALEHALGEIRLQQNRDVDTIVCLQPTSTLRRKNDIADAISQFNDEEADSLFSAHKMEDCCIFQPDGTTWKSVTFDYKNRGRRQDRDPFYWENGSIYIFKPELLEKTHNRIGGKISVYLMPFWASFEIDTEEEVPLIEFYMKKEILAQDFIVT